MALLVSTVLRVWLAPPEGTMHKLPAALATTPRMACLTAFPRLLASTPKPRQLLQATALMAITRTLRGLHAFSARQASSAKIRLLVISRSVDLALTLRS